MRMGWLRASISHTLHPAQDAVLIEPDAEANGVCRESQWHRGCTLGYRSWSCGEHHWIPNVIR